MREARCDGTVAGIAAVAAEGRSRLDPEEGTGPTGKTAQKTRVRLGLLKWDLDTRIRHHHRLSHVDRSMPEDDPDRDVRTRHLEGGAGRRGETHSNEDV